MDATNNDGDPQPALPAAAARPARGQRAHRQAAAHSWARMCDHSCRGTGGAAHAKFFMFSKVGKVKRVVMQGSANLTLASTNNQWNDIYTHIRTRGVWRFSTEVFRAGREGQDGQAPVRLARVRGFRLIMFPHRREASTR